ncbi:hypothetical protein ACIBO5_47315 [Nonomuraea angiospora]|uniref:hypothetical protein n=1 Tax=Nonomuraea angiospora TaxID=46172 RepID=UPI00378F3CD3
MPSVPLAASRVSLVLERLSTPGQWIRTGDVQRFRVRLNGMADGVKVAIAANPAAALTQVSCAPAAAGTPSAPVPAAEPNLGAARAGVRAARALAAQALSVTGGSALPSTVPPGARVCELGDLAGEREVEVTLTTPSGAKQVVLAAVAGMRADAGDPETTKTKTAATRVMDEGAGFSGPAVRVSPAEPRPTALVAPSGVPGGREYAEAKERILAQLQQPAPPARAWAKVRTDTEEAEVVGERAGRRLLAGAGVLLEGQWPAEAAAPRRQAAGGTARRLKGGGLGVPQARRQPELAPQWPQGAPGLAGLPQGAPQAQGLPQAAPQGQGLAQAVPQLPEGVQRRQVVPQLPEGLQRPPQAVPQLPQGLPQVPQLPQGLPQVPQGLPQGLPQAPRLPESVPQPVPGAPPALAMPGASPPPAGGPLLPGMAAPQAAPGATGQPTRGAEGVVPLPWNVAAARKHPRPVAWASPLDGPKGVPVVVGGIGALLGALWLIGTVQRRRKSKT